VYPHKGICAPPRCRLTKGGDVAVLLLALETGRGVSSPRPDFEKRPRHLVPGSLSLLLCLDDPPYGMRQRFAADGVNVS
jgi:hypothetical protein